MLPNIDLDNENFDEIMESARNTIVSAFPEWTDFNAHDPGITMLEMLAWMKESRQYFLNKIGPANFEKYLKLLGISRRHKIPARADVSVRCGEDIVVPEGAKFYAGELCFEAIGRTFVPSAEIVCCIASCGKDKRVIEKSELQFGGNLGIMPFDKENAENGAFYIGFDKPIPAEEAFELYISVENDGGTPRNPITDAEDFIPLVDIKAEYYGKNGWEELEIIRDLSFSFIVSGKMTAMISDDMALSEREGISAYYLRFKIVGGEYDTQPVIGNIDFNFVELRQRDTRSEYHDFSPSESYTLTTELAATGNTSIFLRGKDGTFTSVSRYGREVSEDGSVTYTGINTEGGDLVRIVNSASDFYPKSVIGDGTGLPFQEYNTECADIEYESFQIMTQLPGSEGKYAEWTKVADFSGSGAADMHYVFDSESGIVKFGSCIHGAAPEGLIFVIGYATTAGSGGNVTANKINRLGGAEGVADVINKRSAYGGSDEESEEDCQGRIHRFLDSTHTIITAEDCERRIAETPGLRIENCRVINQASGSSDTVISVVVKPYSPDGRGVPGERCKENIIRYIDRFRMLGTRIEIIPQQYVDISVYADISVSFQSSDARGTIESAIGGFFSKIKNSFGAMVSYGEIYELLESLDCVVRVNTLTVESFGTGVKKNGDGDIILPPNVTAALSETEFILHTA